MSKDSSRTALHLPSPHLADLFEDFCRPPGSNPASSLTATSTSNTTVGNALTVTPTITDGGSGGSSTRVAGSFLPFEDIYLPPHLQPLNPEDEDDVVPQEHAAYGIMRATGRDGAQRGGGGAGGAGAGGEGGGEGRVWRDLGLEVLLRGYPEKEAVPGSQQVTGKREGGKRVLLLR